MLGVKLLETCSTFCEKFYLRATQNFFFRCSSIGESLTKEPPKDLSKVLQHFCYLLPPMLYVHLVAHNVLVVLYNPQCHGGFWALRLRHYILL